MPFTANYNWETPDVGADFGSWGSIQNATIEEIDTDLKALADTVTANALNVAKTNVNNTFTGTQSFAAVTASGTVQGSQLRAISATSPTASAVPWRLDVGSDGSLGPLYAQIELSPASIGVNRLATLQVGDNSSVRDLAIKSSRLYIGNATPTWVASEFLNVEGSVRVVDITASGVFSGSGASLNSIPQSAVTGLVSGLAGKSNVIHTHVTSDVLGLDGALAGKSNVGHTHTPAEILGYPLGYTSPAGAGSRPEFLPAEIDSSSLSVLGGNVTTMNNMLKALVTDLKARGVI